MAPSPSSHTLTSPVLSAQTRVRIASVEPRRHVEPSLRVPTALVVAGWLIYSAWMVLSIRADLVVGR